MKPLCVHVRVLRSLAALYPQLRNSLDAIVGPGDGPRHAGYGVRVSSQGQTVRYCPLQAAILLWKAFPWLQAVEDAEDGSGDWVESRNTVTWKERQIMLSDKKSEKQTGVEAAPNTNMLNKHSWAAAAICSYWHNLWLFEALDRNNKSRIRKQEPEHQKKMDNEKPRNNLDIKSKIIRYWPSSDMTSSMLTLLLSIRSLTLWRRSQNGFSASLRLHRNTTLKKRDWQ